MPIETHRKKKRSNKKSQLRSSGLAVSIACGIVVVGIVVAGMMAMTNRPGLNGKVADGNRPTAPDAVNTPDPTMSVAQNGAAASTSGPAPAVEAQPLQNEPFVEDDGRFSLFSPSNRVEA